MGTHTQRADIPQAPIQEQPSCPCSQFIAKGCDREFLGQLLTCFRQRCETDRRKEEFDSIKSQLKKLVSTERQLKKLASAVPALFRDTEQLFAKPLELLSGKSLAHALPVLRTPQKPTSNPPDFHRLAESLKEAGDAVKRFAESLKETGDILQPLAVRKDTQAGLIKKIYVYCRDATHDTITHSEIADLLIEATEDITSGPIATTESVRLAIKRQKLSDDQEWAYAHNLAGERMRKDKVWDFISRKVRSGDANKTQS